jgi:hypothetical protein
MEPLIHSRLDPSRNLLALLLAPSAFGRDALNRLLGNALHPPLQGHECGAGRRGIFHFQQLDSGLDQAEQAGVFSQSERPSHEGVAAMPEPVKVFVSYASQGRAFAERLVSALKAAGGEV